ncbi:MAG: HD domain-containing protein [Humidesulfovibrio sp.]|uniref:HD domain-containing protein n=1 Tax=Humidesulfovibrio sp. TaxID=2910988 RepID=UPI0027370514|nr:HD domain-containing protein [Humidesulfovibrio sp.]MDP2846782.1 HD domain-containing protein [Humidesulfovibrio sp.]
MSPGRFLGVTCHPEADAHCQKSLARLEAALRAHLAQRLAGEGACDPAHDLLHLERVVATAKRIAVAEGANLRVVIPTAWLHDYVVVPKDDPRRSEASRLAAVDACAYLKDIGYAATLAESGLLEAIGHAIEAHSFSANIAPQTLEAKVVQDADRLDGIGAIGIARCFACSGTMNRPFYSAVDPFCTTREPDDGLFTLDHFYRKLFKTAASMQTAAGRLEAERRVEVMRRFLGELGEEI